MFMYACGWPAAYATPFATIVIYADVIDDVITQSSYWVVALQLVASMGITN